ncbi:MAG: M23 family metallopeptidase [Dermatophilaceae bacterium]
MTRPALPILMLGVVLSLAAGWPGAAPWPASVVWPGSAAGPVAGPSVAGPSVAGPSVAGPQVADPGPAGSGAVARPSTAAAVWAWPVGAPHPVLRRFDPPVQRWESGHRGVDLQVAPGAEVTSPTEGVVSFAGMIAGRGVLVVAHAGGLRSTLEPVTPLVEVGATVRRGQPIAAVQATVGGHCAPALCLHWGVLRGETYLDPLTFVVGRVVLLPLP